MSGTGEIITLAKAAVDFAKLRFIAEALVAAALSSSAADLLPLGFAAGTQVHAAGLSLLALTAGAQVARFTLTSPTGIGTCNEKARIVHALCKMVIILSLRTIIISTTSTMI